METREMRTTTTVPMEIWQGAKLRGIPIRSLIIQGWEAQEKFPAMLARQNELEEKMRRYQFELEATSRKMFELQGKQGGAHYGRN